MRGLPDESSRGVGAPGLPPGVVISPLVVVHHGEEPPVEPPAGPDHAALLFSLCLDLASMLYFSKTPSVGDDGGFAEDWDEPREAP